MLVMMQLGLVMNNLSQNSWSNYKDQKDILITHNNTADYFYW